MRCFVTACFGLLTAFPPSGLQENARLDDLLPRARAALKVDANRPMLQVSGRTERFGLHHPFRWTFAPEGHYLREFKGAFAQTMGDDGVDAWAQEVRSPSFQIHGSERARTRALSWVWSGAWCQAASPFDLTLRESGEGVDTIVLGYELKTSALTGELHLNPTTLCPALLTFEATHGGGRVHFRDWDLENEPPMPRSVRSEDGLGEDLHFQVQDTRVWDRAAPDFANPKSAAKDAGFVEGVPALVPSGRLEGNQWLVHPELDGKVRGAFVLDPNAPRSLMTQSLGASLGYRAFGARPLDSSAQAGDSGSATLQGRFLKLGPFVFEGLRYGQIDPLPDSTTPEQEQPVGVLGWDVFVRSIVILDADRGRVSIHDPATFDEAFSDADRIQWTPMKLVGRTPHLPLVVAGEPDRIIRFDPQFDGAEVQLESELDEGVIARLAGQPIPVRGGALQYQGTPWVSGKCGPKALRTGALVYDIAHSRLGILPAK